jgi:hypothetical protein
MGSDICLGEMSERRVRFKFPVHYARYFACARALYRQCCAGGSYAALGDAVLGVPLSDLAPCADVPGRGVFSCPHGPCCVRQLNFAP